MQIVYCEGCGKRIPQADLDSGQAASSDGVHFHCTACAAKSATASMSAAADARRSRMGGAVRTESATATRTALLKPGTAVMNRVVDRSGRKALASAREKSDRPATTKSNAPLFMAGGAGVLLLVLGLVAVLMSGQEAPKPTKTSEQPSRSARKEKQKAKPVEDAAPKPAPAPRSERPAPPKPEENPMVAMRRELAQSRLDEAKKFQLENPKDPWTYEEKLKNVASTYRGTPGGDEAQKLLANLVVPPRPEPVGAGEWEKVFDGTNKSAFMRNAQNWEIAEGALQSTQVDDSLQTRKTFGDAEVRIRFEVRDCNSVYIAVRQGGPGKRSIGWYNRQDLQPLNGRTNELVFTCLKDEVRATVNGQPMALKQEGTMPTSGHVQINSKEGTLRILSIEERGVKLKVPE